MQGRDFAAFFPRATGQAPQKDRQDLPVRQTLPPSSRAPNGVKTNNSAQKTAIPRWHGACDCFCGTMYSDHAS
jgi:hypothetical protein